MSEKGVCLFSSKLSATGWRGMSSFEKKELVVSSPRTARGIPKVYFALCTLTRCI